MAVAGLAIIAVITIVVYAYHRSILLYLKARKLIAKLPALDQTAFPVVGHSYLLAGTAIQFFKSLNDIIFGVMHKYGGKVSYLWLGPVPVLVIFHPKSAEIILRSSKHIDKSNFYSFTHCWLGTGILTAGGKKWFQRRKLITPSFHFSILEDFLEVMNHQSNTLIDKLKLAKRRENKIDLSKSVTMCALDFICETAMGKTVNAQENEDSAYVKAITRMTDLIQYRVKNIQLWPDFIFYKTQKGKEQKQVLRTLHDFTKSVIRDRISEKNGTKATSTRKLAFLDVLLEAQTEDGMKLPFSGIQEEVDTFMFEGHDTTAAGMTWALYLLGRHPEYQCRVQEEIEDVMGTRSSFKMDDLRKLEYLEQVIKESLRIYPSVPLFARVTSEDCEVDGDKIGKGTNVLVLPYSIHHNPQVWENPSKFDPDRFTKDNSENRHPYAFLPFSAGPRNCIGQKFAIMEEKVILAQILRHYDVISLTKEEDLLLSGDLILKPGSTLEFELKERNIGL